MTSLGGKPWRRSRNLPAMSLSRTDDTPLQRHPEKWRRTHTFTKSDARTVFQAETWSSRSPCMTVPSSGSNPVCSLFVTGLQAFLGDHPCLVLPSASTSYGESQNVRHSSQSRLKLRSSQRVSSNALAHALRSGILRSIQWASLSADQGTKWSPSVSICPGRDCLPTSSKSILVRMSSCSFPDALSVLVRCIRTSSTICSRSATATSYSSSQRRIAWLACIAARSSSNEIASWLRCVLRVTPLPALRASSRVLIGTCRALARASGGAIKARCKRDSNVREQSSCPASSRRLMPAW